MEKKSFKLKDKESKEAFINEETNLIESKINFLKKQLSIHVECQTINDLLSKIEKLIAGGKDSIKLSTIHRAKGLENETIFILDYDRLPLYRDIQKDWERKQENNLKYVAITRSNKYLYLVKSAIINKGEDDESLFDSLNDKW